MPTCRELIALLLCNMHGARKSVLIRGHLGDPALTLHCGHENCVQMMATVILCIHFFHVLF